MEGEKIYSKEAFEMALNEQRGKFEQTCQVLSNRCRMLEEQLMYRRLDYLFKVIELSDRFNDYFVSKCAEEIEQCMTIPSQETEE